MGCSYTHGEGNEDHETFPNLITRGVGAVNAFIFAFFPDEHRFVGRLKPMLEARGIAIFDFSNVNLHKYFGNTFFFPGNGHPTPRAHWFYSELFLKEWRNRKIRFETRP